VPGSLIHFDFSAKFGRFPRDKKGIK